MYCNCGCGELAPVATTTDPKYGAVNGIKTYVEKLIADTRI